MKATHRNQDFGNIRGEADMNRLGLRVQATNPAWKRGAGASGLLMPFAYYRSGLIRLGLSSPGRRPLRKAPALRPVGRGPVSPRPVALRVVDKASPARTRGKAAPGRFLVRVLVAASLLILLLNMTLVAGAVWVWKHPGDLQALLPGVHVNLNKTMDIAVAGTLPLKARFKHDFPIQLDTQIPIRVPVSEVLRIPINETFEVPIEKEISVRLDQPIHVRDTIRVRAQVPLDTVVETKVMGVTMRVPVKGTIPLDFNLPLDQMLSVQGNVKVDLAETLPIHIRHEVTAPIDFVVKGSIPLDQEIRVPIDTELDCAVDIPKAFPIRMDLDISTADLGSGVRWSGGN